jgi:hypothetical protein
MGNMKYYEFGLDVASEGYTGWALFCGVDGEDPKLIGFFTKKEDARLFAAQKDPEDPECLLHCDTDVVPAILTNEGLVSANDFGINTHEELKARIAACRIDARSKL